MSNVHVLLGADHGGFAHKQDLIAWLKERGVAATDCGATTLDPDDDYPQFAKAVAARLSSAGEAANLRGVLLCRSGAGMAIAANRFRGVRAVVVQTREQAIHAREHNDANCVVFSADTMELDQMKECLEAFLSTPFSSEPRHARRIKQLDKSETRTS